MGVSDPRQLASLERALATSKPGAPIGAPQHLLFAVGEVICALPAESVQGVERVTEVTPVPNTAPWLLGVVQVWGSIVSVVDLQAFLGLPPQPPTSRSRLLVVTTGDMNVGFLIPAVVEMHTLGENVAGRVDARAVPEWTRPFAVGALQDGGRSVVVLDPVRLMASEKLHRYQGA
jgi:purine-binding chemotaxis protein CheW